MGFISVANGAWVDTKSVGGARGKGFRRVILMYEQFLSPPGALQKRASRGGSSGAKSTPPQLWFPIVTRCCGNSPSFHRPKENDFVNFLFLIYTSINFNFKKEMRDQKQGDKAVGSLYPDERFYFAGTSQSGTSITKSQVLTLHLQIKHRRDSHQ